LYTQQIIYTEADEVQLLPEDKAVCCSVCNIQC